MGLACHRNIPPKKEHVWINHRSSIIHWFQCVFVTFLHSLTYTSGKPATSVGKGPSVTQCRCPWCTSCMKGRGSTHTRLLLTKVKRHLMKARSLTEKTEGKSVENGLIFTRTILRKPGQSPVVPSSSSYCSMYSSRYCTNSCSIVTSLDNSDRVFL